MPRLPRTETQPAPLFLETTSLFAGILGSLALTLRGRGRKWTQPVWVRHAPSVFEKVPEVVELDGRQSHQNPRIIEVMIGDLKGVWVGFNLMVRR